MPGPEVGSEAVGEAKIMLALEPSSSGFKSCSDTHQLCESGQVTQSPEPYSVSLSVE